MTAPPTPWTKAQLLAANGHLSDLCDRLAGEREVLRKALEEIAEQRVVVAGTSAAATAANLARDRARRALDAVDPTKEKP